MINIYDVNGKVLMQAEITSSAIRVEELSKSDYISLSWNSAEKVILPAGAYIVHKYKIDKVREVTRQFRLLESYEPTQSDEMSCKYTPEFQHPKMVLSKKPFFIRTRNSKNEVIKQYDFDFCGTMVTIADRLKDFLNNELKFGNAGWIINYDTTNTNAINVSFSDNDFMSALTAITNAIGDNCEWHIDYDNETIHIGNVLRDDLPIVTLKVGENVGIPSITNSKEDYYNAFAVFGGTRNITQVNDKGENISSSDIKLQLSKGSGTTEIDGKKLSYSIDEFSTIDMRQNKNEQLFTKILNFAQIFPSINTYVYNVRGREKYVLQDGNKIPLTYNADGSVKTYKTFTVWYVRMAYPTTEKIANKKLVNTTVDNGVTHYWYDFEITDDLLINGKNIGCSFEANFNEGALSTPLAGRGTNGDYVGFELTYHKEASSTHTTDDVDSSNFAVLAGDFEIIYQEDNDLIIPTNAKDMIIPKGESLPSYKCNITVLYNIAMAESIYTEDAQKRLLDAAMKEIKRLLSDLNNYSVKSYPQVFEAKNPCLQIGQKVVYDNGNGYQLNTRAQKISTNIDFEFVQEITVGNEVIKGNTAQLKEDVKEIIASGGSGSGGGGNYTTSQLRNLIGKYGISYFVSKLFDDTAEGLITFAKGLIAKGLADLMMGAKFGNNAMITELGEAVFSAIKSLDYDNAAEQGFSVEKEKNGKYHAFVTNFTVWGKAIFHELEVRKLSYSGGNIYLSGAGSKLIKVVPVKKLVSADGVISWVETAEDDMECVGWKCYLLADNGTTATMNDWQEGDQARCQTMGEIVAGGAYSDVSNKSYWRTIPDGGVSTQNEKIYGTKTETYLDEDGNEQTRKVQVELYDGQAFAWIVVGKHCDDIDGYDDEFSVGYNGSNPAPLETRDIPSAGDTIVLDGNRHRNGQQEYDKTDRQNVIILETTGEYAPRIACYANITEYKHTFTKSVNGSDKEVSLSVFETSPKGGTKINSSRFEWISDDGSTINIINYRGDWVDGNTYHKNDQVNHNNAVWVCVADSGVNVDEEPSDGATYWKKVLSGGKGEKGDDAVSYGIQFSERITTISSVETKVLDVRFIKSVGQQITSGSINDIGFNGTCVVYIDGVMNDKMTDRLNSGQTYLDIYHAFADEIKGKKGLSVELRNSDQIVVASNTFSFAESGEGVVMAYKNAPSRPEPPTTKDPSALSDGWSRTPQKGGSYIKVDNISYGSFDNGASLSVDSTSKSWTDVTEDGNSWKKSPSGLSDRFGWAIMKVSFSTHVDNLDIKVIIKAYSEANFDFIQVHALDTEITGSSDLLKKGVVYTSGNGVEDSYSYHVATAGQHFFYVSYCKDTSGNSNGDYGLFRFDLPDNLVSMPSTVWMSQAILKEGKAVLPWSTPVQITGDDAYRVEVSPSTLVFDTNENGLVDSATLSGKYATVTVYKGNQKISADNLSLPSNYVNPQKKYTNVDGKISNVNGEARITINKIEQETISGDEKVSKSSGQISFPIDVLGERSTLMWVTVNVQVNVSKFTGSVAFDNKGYKAQFDELSKNAATKDELKDVTSTFEQTARKISLSVSEKSIARRNLLVGSAFLREDNHVEINEARIEMNTGYQGTNCIRISDDTTDGKTRYPGAFWDGSQGGKSVRITKGKKYVISCWYYTNDTNGHLSLEALYTDKQTNAERKGAPKYLSAGSLVPKPNQWQLFTTVIDTTDAEYDYIAFNFYEYCSVESGLIEAYICRPMVEEGDTYNGWTLSQNDYDIIGANLIDNSRTLDVGGNVLEVNGQKALVGDAYELTYIGSDDYNTFYRIKGSTFQLGVDYTISFEVRGDAEYMGVYAYYPITNTKFTFYAEPQNGAMTEVTDGGKVDNYVALIQVKELSKQQRVWSHFRFEDRLPEYIYFQFPKNSEQTGVTSWSVTITKPKIEVGAVVTEYTERKSDLVDKASLKAAGIEITSEKVKLYGDQIEVKPKKDGNDVYALFGSDGFINTNILNVQHVYAKNTNGAVYGHFGYLGAEGGTDSAGNQYPLWVGASNCGYAPFSVRSDGYMVTTSGRIGAWSLTERNLTTGAVVDSNYGTYMGTCLSMSEMDTAYNANNCKFLVAMGKGAFYYDPFSPLKSGFYEDAKFRGNASERSDRFHVNSNNEHTYLSNSFYSSMYIKKEIGENSSSSRVDVSQPALLVDSDGVGITSPGGNFFGGLAIGVLEAKTTTDGQDASSSIREQLDDNRGAFVTINNASGKTTKFYLPKYPQEGQMLIVLQINSGTIQFYASNSKLMAFKNTLYRSGEYWTSTTQGQFSVFVYANGAWRIQLMNGR